jgi:hypothetical protein
MNKPMFQLAWFVALWVLSVVSLGAISFVIRYFLIPS